MLRHWASFLLSRLHCVTTHESVCVCVYHRAGAAAPGNDSLARSGSGRNPSFQPFVRQKTVSISSRQRQIKEALIGWLSVRLCLIWIWILSDLYLWLFRLALRDPCIPCPHFSTILKFRELLVNCCHMATRPNQRKCNQIFLWKNKTNSSDT